jgi:ATP-dependent Clp protease ATP-binding subunit ClpA
MDHGKLTDHNGKQVDFRNVIIIMTTNAGAAEMQKAAIGFGSTKRTGDDEEAINRLFAPEFRNRLDAIIAFDSLPPEIVHRVVEKFIMQLEAQLSERGVVFELTKEAVAWLAKRGFDERMGARPLARVIQEHIKKPLADEVLFGKLKTGGTVKVSVATDKEGAESLKLELVEDRPVKPVPPDEVSRKTAAKKAKGAKSPVGRGKPKGVSGGGGLVPKVPLKI